MQCELEGERKKNQIGSGECALYRTRLGPILGHTPLTYAVTKAAISSRHDKVSSSIAFDADVRQHCHDRFKPPRLIARMGPSGAATRRSQDILVSRNVRNCTRMHQTALLLDAKWSRQSVVVFGLLCATLGG